MALIKSFGKLGGVARPACTAVTFAATVSSANMHYAEVGTATIIDETNCLTVISTLGNVVGCFGDDNASGSRHEEQCTIIRAGCQETLLSQMPLVRADEFSEEYRMGSESRHSIELPPRLVPLGKVLAIASFSLSLAAWLYTPGGVFLIIAEFIRPMLFQYTGAAFGSAMPLAGVAFGLWATWRGRRECGTFWFVIAVASVFVSGNLVIANFAIPVVFGSWK